MNKFFYSRHIFFLRTETDHILVVSMLFSVLMAVASLSITSYPGSLFLVWNLFLAYIPYSITNWIGYRPGWIENRWKFALAFVAWFFFIPNSFYLLTDLFHLGEVARLPLWYHLIMLVSFAWNGLLLGIVSIRQMERILELYWGDYTRWFFIYPMMWLNSVGVYIGRYLRFNSWDIITDPVNLVGNIITILLHPVSNKQAWSMVFCFSVFMTLVYLVLRRIGKMIG